MISRLKIIFIILFSNVDPEYLTGAYHEDLSSTEILNINEWS